MKLIYSWNFVLSKITANFVRHLFTSTTNKYTIIYRDI